jgi:hypothetical protein
MIAERSAGASTWQRSVMISRSSSNSRSASTARAIPAFGFSGDGNFSAASSGEIDPAAGDVSSSTGSGSGMRGRRYTRCWTLSRWVAQRTSLSLQVAPVVSFPHAIREPNEAALRWRSAPRPNRANDPPPPPKGMRPLHGAKMSEPPNVEKLRTCDRPMPSSQRCGGRSRTPRGFGGPIGKAAPEAMHSGLAVE